MGTQTSCISHPANQRLVVLREDYLKLCEGNHCAAALLNLFEHGHNYKLANQKDALHHNDVAERHGEPGHQSTSLLQYYTEEALEEGLLHLYHRQKTIRPAIALLVSKGFVTIHKNPNPRYHFDKTHYFMFHPEVVQPQLLDLFDEVKRPHRRGQKTSPSGQKTSPSGQKTSTRSLDYYPEITVLEIPPSPSVKPPPLGDTRKKRRAAISHFVPEDFCVTPTMEAWAAKECPEVDHVFQTALFRDHEFDKPHSDWSRAWHNWMRNAVNFSPRKVQSKQREQERERGIADLVSEIKAKEASRGH